MSDCANTYEEHLRRIGVLRDKPPEVPREDVSEERQLNQLWDLYEDGIRNTRDIQEHMTVLFKYASLCRHVTELGTSCGCSTSAFVMAKPDVLRTYDHKEHARVHKVCEVARCMGIDFVYTIQDVLTVDIAETDLLFIDTWHCQQQMAKELEMHAPKASRFLIMHDTETFGIRGENNPFGIWWAVREYMREHPEWELHEHRQNNNGLTIFKRHY